MTIAKVHTNDEKIKKFGQEFTSADSFENLSSLDYSQCLFYFDDDKNFIAS